VREPRGSSGGVSPDSVDQFVDLLTERFGQPAQWDERKGEGGDKYNKYEVVLLATLCRHRGSPEVKEDLTMEHLPKLWHQMWNMQLRNSHLHTFVEGYIMEKSVVLMWLPFPPHNGHAPYAAGARLHGQ
jgi:hypothetical protein